MAFWCGEPGSNFGTMCAGNCSVSSNMDGCATDYDCDKAPDSGCCIGDMQGSKSCGSIVPDGNDGPRTQADIYITKWVDSNPGITTWSEEGASFIQGKKVKSGKKSNKGRLQNRGRGDKAIDSIRFSEVHLNRIVNRVINE